MKFLLGFLILFSANVAAEQTTLITPRNATIELIAQFPDGTGPFATVVLAPGQGYHMQLPSLEGLANKLVAEGIAVYRFNWAYYTSTPRGNPSDGFALEIEDMQTVVSAAKGDPRVDSKRLWASGKSLGSSVAWHVLSQDPSLRGGALLTPVCSQVMEGATTPTPIHEYYYPGILEETRPLIFALGDSDPLCDLPVLYSLLSKLSGPSRLAVAGGDHGFQELPLAGDEAFEKNIIAISNIVTLAIAQWSVPD